MKANEWLLDSNFIEHTNYKDKYYLSSLGVHLINYIRDIPIPALTTYKDKTIGFFVGSESKFFKIDNTIYYKDFITLIDRWMSKFFPSFDVPYTVYHDLPDEEILKMVKNGIDLNDALTHKIQEEKIEHGVIEKITLKRDEFILNIDDKRTLRMSGFLNHPISLTKFLEELKQIKIQEDRKKFILDKSLFIKDIGGAVKECIITYQGKQLLNFFKINYEDNKNFPLTSIEPFLYQWGKYKIKFESESLKNDCLKFYNEQQIKEPKKIYIKRTHKENVNDNNRL